MSLRPLCPLSNESPSIRAPSHRTLPYIYLSNLVLGEPLCLRSQQVGNLRLAHTNLVPNGHKACSEVHVVLAQQRDGHHNVVDILEHKRVAIAVLRFGLDEGERVVTPMAAWVEVVGRVVAIVDAVAVGLSPAKPY